MRGEFAIAHVAFGDLNRVVKKLMESTGATSAAEAVRLFNSGEWIVSPTVHEGKQEENPSNPSFVIADVMPGKLNAFVKNVMDQLFIEDPAQAIELFVSGARTFSRFVRLWTERDGIISFTYISDGTTGPQWIKRLGSKKCRLTDGAKEVLCAQNFVPTPAGTVVHMKIWKGDLFSPKNVWFKPLGAIAARSGYVIPNVEAICYMRDMFSNNEIQAMGLRKILIERKCPPTDRSELNTVYIGTLGTDLAALRANGAHWENEGAGFAYASAA